MNAKQNADYATALDKFYEARECILELSDGEESFDTASLLANIGQIHCDLGDYERAIEELDKAMRIWKIISGGHHPFIATGLVSIGLVYDYLGDYDLALDFYEKALEVYKVYYEDQHPSIATVYNNIAGVYSSIGDYESALEFHNKALEIDISVNGENHSDVAIDYCGIGYAYLQIGDYERAIEFNEKALKIFIAFHGERHPNVSASYANIGDIYLAQREYDRALEFYDKALNIRMTSFGKNHPFIADAYNRMGNVYIALGAYDRAYDSSEQALEAQCSGTELPDAVDCKPEASTVNAFLLRAESASKMQEYDVSITAYENAAVSLEKLRGNIESKEAKTFQGSQYYEMFPKGIGAFAALFEETGDTFLLNRSYAFAEKGIGRVFLELIGRSRAIVDGGLPENVINKGLNLKARWKAAVDAIVREESKPLDEQSQELRKQAYEIFEESEKAFDEYVARLYQDYPEFAELRNPRIHSLEDIRETVLAPDEAALEYILGEDASWLIFITEDDIRIEKLPPSSEIEAKINTFRTVLTTAKTEESRSLIKQATALYDMLIGPVDDELSDLEGLLIVPTGKLYFLPFEALMTEYRQGPGYLAEGFDVRYAPSLNVAYLVANRGKEYTRSEQWIGFGDPVYQWECDARARSADMSDDTAYALANYTRALEADENRGELWCRIPATGDEVLAIAEQMGVEEGGENLYLDEEASEFNFKQLAPSGSRFLHVASHGTLGEGGSRQPALVLSLIGNEDAGEDGFLTMTEVFNMKTPAEMVVLSACETGRGKMEKGEGVAGMARAFLYSGADSLVVSLWSVADEQTKDLMVRFYERILDGEDRQAALTATKREMIEQGLTPFYWAPFIYIGIN